MEKNYIVTDFNNVTIAEFDKFWEAVEYAREYAMKHNIYTNAIDRETEEIYSYDNYGNWIESPEEEVEYDEPYDPFDEVGYNHYMGGYDSDW